MAASSAFSSFSNFLIFAIISSHTSFLQLLLCHQVDGTLAGSWPFVLAFHCACKGLPFGNVMWHMKQSMHVLRCRKSVPGRRWPAKACHQLCGSDVRGSSLRKRRASVATASSIVTGSQLQQSDGQSP